MPAETMIALLAATLLATGWALWVLPVGTCRQCPHCQVEQLAKEREVDAQLARAYGTPRCAACGRHHHPGEDHRV